MADDNAAFMDLLADCTEQCENIDLNDDQWMPPDATYLVSIDEIRTGVKEKEGVKNIWVKPVFSIHTEGEFEGKSFTDFYYITPGSDERRNSMSLRNLLRFATCVAGTETKNPVEAIQILQDSLNEFLNVEVYRTTGKKGGTFTNIRFLSKLESTEG